MLRRGRRVPCRIGGDQEHKVWLVVLGAPRVPWRRCAVPGLFSREIRNEAASRCDWCITSPLRKAMGCGASCLRTVGAKRCGGRPLHAIFLRATEGRRLSGRTVVGNARLTFRRACGMPIGLRSRVHCVW